MRKLVPTAPIAGNLALKITSESFSATQAGYENEFESATAPSRSLPLRLVTDAQDRSVFLGVISTDIKKQPSDQLDLNFSAKTDLGTETTITFEPKALLESLGKGIRGFEYTGDSIVVTFFDENLAAMGWATGASNDLQPEMTVNCGVETWPLTNSIRLVKHSPEVLGAKFKELHEQFSSWPGSYNQLLLAGSLDYCRSAIGRAKKHGVELPLEVLEALKAFYGSCLSLFDQNQDSRTAFRRLNLQSLQDKFENLQILFAEKGVYPRLEELGVEDAPADQ